MGILRRTFVMVAAGCILAAGSDAFAKAPRLLLNAVLTAAPGAPPAAKGKAKYDQTSSRTNFSVEAQNLTSLNGKVVTVFVNGTAVGSGRIALGRFKLQLTNQRGGSVPSVTRGSTVQLSIGASVLMRGSF